MGRAAGDAVADPVPARGERATEFVAPAAGGEVGDWAAQGGELLQPRRKSARIETDGWAARPVTTQTGPSRGSLDSRGDMNRSFRSGTRVPAPRGHARVEV